MALSTIKQTNIVQRANVEPFKLSVLSSTQEKDRGVEGDTFFCK